MKVNWARWWTLGCLVACLGATTASCSDSDDGGAAPPPPTDLERGTMAATREDACYVENWGALDVHESLGILLSVFPGSHKRGVDCILAAHDCQEVEACAAFFSIDDEPYADLNLPECGSDTTSHCEGNVVKYCVSDDSKTWYQASYDCALAGATCVEFDTDPGERSANCQAPQLRCEAPRTSYCDGTRAVICDATGSGLGPLSPWVFDCADAWGSHCVLDATSDAKCEGPVVDEQQGGGTGGEGGGGGTSG